MPPPNREVDLVQFVKDLRDKVRISEVIGRHVELRQRGRALLGLCPFHNEKTPSFNVNDEQGYYHCFGCGAGGDAVKFLREIEGLDFVAAVRRMAEIAGVPMPELKKETPERRQARQREETERDGMMRLHRESVDFFRAAFAASDFARAYAAKRGLTPQAIERFEIGYAPDDWSGLVKHLTRGGTTDNLVAGAGLASRSSKPGSEGRLFDRFRNRLIFPICDGQGKHVAFGARAIAPDDEPKYLNSPETPIYRKSYTLYGLHIARAAIREKRSVLLLEGYMDVVAMWQAGFHNAVASCGTSLTREQAGILARLCDKVLFLYDGDDAGQKAMLRGAVELLSEGLQVKVISLPKEHDPDSLLKDLGPDRGPAELQRHIDAATDAFEHFLRAALAKYGASTVEGRVRVGSEMMDLLAAVRHPIARANYEALLAEVVGMPVAQLRSEVARRVRPASPPRETEAGDDGPPRDRSGSDDEDESLSDESSQRGFVEAQVEVSPIERALLRLALERPELRPVIAETIPAEWIESALVARLLSEVLPQTGVAADILQLLETPASPRRKKAQADDDGAEANAPMIAFVRETLLFRSEDFANANAQAMLDHLRKSMRRMSHRRAQSQHLGSLRMSGTNNAQGEEPSPALRSFDQATLEHYDAAAEYYGGARLVRARKAKEAADADKEERDRAE